MSSHMLRILHVLELLRSCYALCQLFVLEVQRTVPQYFAESSLLRCTVHAHNAHYTLHILLSITQIAEHNMQVTAGINDILKSCAGQRIPRDVTINLPPTDAEVAKQIEDLQQCVQQQNGKLAAAEGDKITAVCAVTYAMSKVREKLTKSELECDLLKEQYAALNDQDVQNTETIGELEGERTALQKAVADRDATIAALQAQLAAQAASISSA
jgi:hypothetical protein